MAANVIELMQRDEVAVNRAKADLKIVEKDDVQEIRAAPIEESRRKRFLVTLDKTIPVLVPLDPRNVVWQCAMMCVVLVALVLMPLELCVPYFGKEHPEQSVFYRLGSAIDVTMLLDMAVTFNTAIYEEDELLLDRRVIAKRYLQSWFTPDLLSSFPFQLAFRPLDVDKGITSLRVLRLFRVVKVVRCVKLVRLFKALHSKSKWEDDKATELATQLGRIGVLVLTVLLIAHYAACIMVAIAGGDEKGWRHNSWVAEYFNNGRRLSSEDDDDLSDDFFHHQTMRGLPTTSKLYVVAMYWAMTTLTTIGFGDVVPVTQGEMVWTMIVQFIGSCTLGYVMGGITQVFTREDKSTQLIKSKILTINSYMRHRRLPHELKLLIRRHYTYMWKNSSVFDEQKILEELPTNIRSRVVMALNRPVLDKIRFLSDGISPQIKTALCMQLTSLQILEGDAVIVEGEVGTDAYIVKNGTLSAFIQAASTVAQSLHIHRELAVMKFTDGDIFCEYALLQGRVAKHPFTVNATDAAVEILALSQTSFRKLVVEFPILDDVFRQLAVERFARLMDALSSRTKLKAIARERRPRHSSAGSKEKSSWGSSGGGFLSTRKSTDLPTKKPRMPSILRASTSRRFSPTSLLSSRDVFQKKVIKRKSGSIEYCSDDESDDDLLRDPGVEKTRLELHQAARAIDPLDNLSNRTKLSAQLWAKRGIMRQAMRGEISQREKKPSLHAVQFEPDCLALSTRQPPPSSIPPRRTTGPSQATRSTSSSDDRIANLERAVCALTKKLDVFLQRQYPPGDYRRASVLSHSTLTDDDDDDDVAYHYEAAAAPFYNSTDNRSGAFTDDGDPNSSNPSDSSFPFLHSSLEWRRQSKSSPLVVMTEEDSSPAPSLL